jgi:hypothetical protein
MHCVIILQYAVLCYIECSVVGVLAYASALSSPMQLELLSYTM